MTIVFGITRVVWVTVRVIHAVHVKPHQLILTQVRLIPLSTACAPSATCVWSHRPTTYSRWPHSSPTTATTSHIAWSAHSSHFTIQALVNFAHPHVSQATCFRISHHAAGVPHWHRITSATSWHSRPTSGTHPHRNRTTSVTSRRSRRSHHATGAPHRHRPTWHSHHSPWTSAHSTTRTWWGSKSTFGYCGHAADEVLINIWLSLLVFVES